MSSVVTEEQHFREVNRFFAEWTASFWNEQCHINILREKLWKSRSHPSLSWHIMAISRNQVPHQHPPHNKSSVESGATSASSVTSSGYLAESPLHASAYHGYLTESGAISTSSVTNHVNLAESCPDVANHGNLVESRLMLGQIMISRGVTVDVVTNHENLA